MLVKQNVYLKVFCLFCLFFIHSLSANTLPFAWTNQAPANSPSAANGGSMAFDPRTGRTLFFGGLDSNVTNSTWVYNSSTNTWANLNPSNPPPPRYNASMVFNPCTGQMILFGGIDSNGPLNDTWNYNPLTNAWVNLNPINSPSPRYSTCMTFDACVGQLILFGGNVGGGTLNDTWRYNGDTNTWTNLNPANPPAIRDGASLIFNPGIGQNILFGGINGNTGSPLNDTWGYDAKANTWANIATPNSPPGRFNSSMTFDSSVGQLVLFGGSDGSTLLNETWKLSISSGTLYWRNPIPSNPPPFEQAQDWHLIPAVVKVFFLEE